MTKLLKICTSLIMLFFLGSMSSLAQVRPSIDIEELTNSLTTIEGEERVKTLHKLTSYKRFSNPEEALEYSEEALSLSQEIKNDSLIAESNYYLGVVSILRGETPKALESLLDARTGFKELGITRREISAGSSLASVYSEIGQFEKALDIYFTGLEYSRETENIGYEIFTLTRIGTVQRELGEYSSARGYYKDAIRAAIDSDGWVNGTLAMAELGNLESSFGNKDTAAFYYQKAADWLREKNSIHAVPSLLSNVGNILKDQNRLSEAFKIQKEVIAVADSLNNSLFVINGLIELAVIQRMMGDYENSNASLEESMSKMQESNIANTTRYNILNQLAENYYVLGQYSKAAELAAESFEITMKNKTWKGAEASLVILSETNIKQGYYEEAVQNQKELSQVRDSIRNEERIRNSQEFDAIYSLSRKEQEIALLEVANERKSLIQKGLTLGVVLVLIIAALIIRSQFLRIQRREAKLENESLKRKRLEQDLEFKNKQLVTQSLNIVQKKELMMEMKKKVELFEEEGSRKELSRLSNLIDYSFTLDADWEEFRMRFEEVHSDFYKVLKGRYGELTPNEMKLSALIKLNLRIKEMAAILGITPDGVKKARYRLRKKLGLDTEENLVAFMQEIEKRSLAIS